MNGPAEVQILRVSESFTATLVPVTRMACRPCGIHEVLPVLQARAVAVAHNKEFHPTIEEEA